MADVGLHQRDRSRSPRRRSRSPRHRNRSYSPRSRSRSRDGYRRGERRSRSPAGVASRGQARGYDDKPPSMTSVRDNSQQDRRVYVGNLSYDVKWHHLKDFMRQGSPSKQMNNLANFISRRSFIRRRTASSQWNVKGGLIQTGLLAFPWLV
jgi:RNA recognition motif-containing protein